MVFSSRSRDGFPLPPRPADPVSPLAVAGLTVAYHDRPVLWDVDFVAPPAGLVAVLGPNGAGKSTFLKAVLGLIPKLAGEVRFFGRALDRKSGLVAYVPQRTAVDWDFPITAVEVVAMGLYHRIGWLRPVRRRHLEAARAQLDRVGLADLADRQIGQLSGGQQQRVFLARALAQDARLYLLDEPLAGIDAASEQVVVELLRELRAAGRTVIVVHHDLESVPGIFDEAMLLNVRRIAAGPVGTVLTPANLARAYGVTFAPKVAAVVGG